MSEAPKSPTLATLARADEAEIGDKAIAVLPGGGCALPAATLPTVEFARRAMLEGGLLLQDAPDGEPPVANPIGESGRRRTVVDKLEEDTNKDGQVDKITTVTTIDEDGDGTPERTITEIDEDRNGDGKFEKRSRVDERDLGPIFGRAKKTFVDENGDGVFDGFDIEFDMNADGKVDVRSRTRFRDTDGDGKRDEAVTEWDTDLDGKFDNGTFREKLTPPK